MYTGFIWSSIWSIRWLLWLGIFLSSWETMSFLSGLLFQSNYLTWKSITLFQKIRIQCTELWWLVDRGSQYNLGWFPTWCTNFYLFTYNTFIKILYMFRALTCSSSGGLLLDCVYAASGMVTVCRWLSCAPVKKEFFLNRYPG